MSNGIKFDARGRMIVAEGADYGGRRVTRTDLLEVWQTWKNPKGLKMLALLNASNMAVLALLARKPGRRSAS